MKKKQQGISTLGAALITGGAVAAAAAALGVYQQQTLMHVRGELTDARTELQTANASANAARTQLTAIRKELDEHKMDFEQMRAERDSAKTLLEAEKQHIERIRTELNLAHEQLAATRTRPATPVQATRSPVMRIVPSAASQPASQPMGAPSQVQPYSSGR